VAFEEGKSARQEARLMTLGVAEGAADEEEAGTVAVPDAEGETDAGEAVEAEERREEDIPAALLLVVDVLEEELEVFLPSKVTRRPTVTPMRRRRSMMTAI
jgi:hypothetical protein